MMPNKHPSQCDCQKCSESKARSVVRQDTLRRETIQIERKTFALQLQQNYRGAFIRIIEETVGRRNCVIVPSTGIEGFLSVLGSLAKTASERKLQGGYIH